MTKPSVRTWDFSALNREHGWAWPGEHTVSEHMIYGRLAPAVSRRASTRDVRPDHDLIPLRRDLPVLPLRAYDYYEHGTNPRHLLQRFRETVTADPDARPWEAPDLYHYPEELCLARGRLADLLVQESTFTRRGDVAANIVIATGNVDRFGDRFTRGAVVASVGDSDNRTNGLATYNTVAVDWRGSNMSAVMWVIKREFGRPAWTLIRKLWLEFIAGAQQERRSMMAPLGESVALAIQRTAARGVDVRPEVLESANHWQDVVKELLTMKKSETEEGAAAPAWAGVHAGLSDAAKANERLEARISRGRSRGTAPRARTPGPTPEEFRGTAELLAKMAERIDAMGETVEELTEQADGRAERIESVEQRLGELAAVVEELREDAGEETDVPNDTTPPG